MDNEKITVIDFETANSDYNSACSIGIVTIENKKIVNKNYLLINPIGGYTKFNTSIHGLSEKDTENEKNWGEIFPEIKHYFDGKVVAHSNFDKIVLEHICKCYGLDISEKFEYIDTVKLARKELPKLENHQLKTLVKHFNFGEFNHHNAIADAEMCEKIYLKLTALEE